MYELGVCDNGLLLGIERSEMDSSISTLEAMASGLGAAVMILREVEVQCSYNRGYDGHKSDKAVGSAMPTDVTKSGSSDTIVPPHTLPMVMGIKPELLFTEKRKRKKILDTQPWTAQRSVKALSGSTEIGCTTDARDAPVSTPSMHQLSRSVSYGDDDEDEMGFLSFDDTAESSLTPSTPSQVDTGSPDGGCLPPFPHIPSSDKVESDSRGGSLPDSLSTSLSISYDGSKAALAHTTPVGVDLDPEEEECQRLRRLARKQWKKERAAAKQADKKANGWVRGAQPSQQHQEAKVQPGVREEKFLDGLVSLFEGVQVDGDEQQDSSLGDRKKDGKYKKKSKSGPIPPSSGRLSKHSWPPMDGTGDCPLTPELRKPRQTEAATAEWAASAFLTGESRRFAVECLVFYPSDGTAMDDDENTYNNRDGQIRSVDNTLDAPVPGRTRLPSFIDYERAFM